MSELRDQIAIAAMAELMKLQGYNWSSNSSHYLAEDAYGIADAMLKERLNE